MTTIEDIYTALNPLPAMLSTKGKIEPIATFTLETNAGISVSLSWRKPHSGNNWEREYQSAYGQTFEETLAKTINYITKLPSAEDAKLQDFMKRLGKVIDVGKDYGVSVDFLNPLLESMKRLSENAITYVPDPQHDDIPL
ncbi:hypothetical protein ACRQ5Q_14675 [Bradyrhizobium sp. PMVTL-01]|uniref:hypothetical protein n=1 Tax=Bradyrhizobium sp. PMVTL-01 TaxID=3434999 RepID=UPI003F6F9F9A